MTNECDGRIGRRDPGSSDEAPVGMQRHVLVGADGSPESATALLWARWFASITGRQLHLAHAWQHGRALDAPPLVGTTLDESGLGESGFDEADVETRLAVFASDVLGESKTLPSCRALRGETAPALVKEAVRSSADLLVVGARGHGSRGRLQVRLGSVSRRLSECPQCATAIIPPDSLVTTDDRWTMLVGVDGSAGSSRALRWAAEAAAAGGGDLVVVHALQLEPDLLPEEVASLAAEARRRLTEEWCGPLRVGGIPHRVVMELGDPQDVIAATAATEDPACIVLGSRGLGAISQRLLGSVTRAIVGFARWPTVIVPSPRDRIVWAAPPATEWREQGPSKGPNGPG